MIQYTVKVYVVQLHTNSLFTPKQIYRVAQSDTKLMQRRKLGNCSPGQQECRKYAKFGQLLREICVTLCHRIPSVLRFSGRIGKARKNDCSRQ